MKKNKKKQKEEEKEEESKPQKQTSEPTSQEVTSESQCSSSSEYSRGDKQQPERIWGPCKHSSVISRDYFGEVNSGKKKGIG